MSQKLAEFDRPYYDVGPFVVGVDEVGRGPLAGPVVAAACYLPLGFLLEGITDSKKLSAKKREMLFQALKGDSRVHFAIGQASVQEIDEINIYRATQLAMMRAVRGLSIVPSIVLVDAMPLPDLDCQVIPIIQGDAQSQVIAAASILAKQTRDNWMLELDRLYPGYHLSQNMGYPTASHLAALDTLGPCSVHRHSYKPVAQAAARHAKLGLYKNHT